MNISQFDWLYYINKYDDLKQASINTEQLALEHYINHGFHEGRCCNRIKSNIVDTNEKTMWLLCTSINSGDYITALTYSQDRIIFDVTDINLHTDDTIVCMDYTLCNQLINISCNKIAWIRNNERNWIPFLNLFNTALCCTHKAKQFISVYCVDTRVFPIHTTFEEYDFNVQPTYDILIDCNLFNRRNVVDYVLRLKRDSRYKLKIVGRGWQHFCTPDEFELIRNDYYGFVAYDDIKSNYLDARIIIDDCNIQTIEFGSVNKRVVDAISCKRLVVTNNEIGNMDMFNGLLVTYSSYETLLTIIESYSTNPIEYNKVVDKLYDYLKSNQTKNDLL